MATYIYIPAIDEEIGAAKVALIAKLDKPKDAAIVVEEGTQALGNADHSSSKVYVLGHGNWGAGIGTHGKHFGARRLTEKLINEGLSTAQTDLEIHLYACNTGVAGTRVVGTRRPYVARLGDALAAKHFTNTKVIGYVGFLKILSLTLCSQYKAGAPAGKGASPTADKQVIYQVQNGACTQLSGGEWGMESSFAWRTVDIVKKS